VVEEIKVIVLKTTVFTVTIANRNVIRCNSHCPKLTWFIQGHEFQSNLKVLKLGRCDVIHGIDWLWVYSPILFNFIKMKLSLRKEERMINVAELQIIGVTKMHKSLKDAVYRFIGKFF
jgi:hypothetical protein